MPDDEVTEEEVEQLWRWGEALLEDPRPEVRAAGKAIVILAAEVDRLERQLWHTELGIVPASEPSPDDDSGVEPERAVSAELLAAVRRALRPRRRAREARPPTI